LFNGRIGLYQDDFIKTLKGADPKPIEIRDGIVTNTRHGCTITEVAPAKACPEALPIGKGYHLDVPVFDVKLDKNVLHCVAYPPDDLDLSLSYSRDHILEQRSFPVADGTVEFCKSQYPHAKRKSFTYKWHLPLPRAVYQFLCFSDSELPPEQVATLERVVQSFKLQPTAT
jgi:hypothetical protein